MDNSSRFQFRIRGLLALTTVVAVILAVAIRIDAPWIVNIVLAAYFIVFGGWIAVRAPGMYREFSDLRKRWRELNMRRVEAKREIAKKIKARSAKTQ